jgi:hypothetical protein
MRNSENIASPRSKTKFTDGVRLAKAVPVCFADAVYAE